MKRKLIFPWCEEGSRLAYFAHTLHMTVPVRAAVSTWHCIATDSLHTCRCACTFSGIQAVLAINRLGPSTAARAHSNSFLRTCCSTYTTTSHFLSVKTQNCDPTCTSPATGQSSTHSGPGNTTRQICTLRRGGHVPKAPPVRTLTGRTHRSCMRAPPAPLTCPAALEVERLLGTHNRNTF